MKEEKLSFSVDFALVAAREQVQ